MSSEEGEFVFTWRIEGFHMLPLGIGECLVSPLFSTGRFSYTKWCLTLYPRGDRDSTGDFISCYLTRKADNGLISVEIEYEISVNSDKRTGKYSFEKSDSYGFSNAFKRHDFSSHENICIVVCNMRKRAAEITEIKLDGPELVIFPSFYKPAVLAPKILDELLSTGRELRGWQKSIGPKNCFARTRVSVERRSVTCSVKDIIRLRGAKLCLPVPSCSEYPSLLIILDYTIVEENTYFEVTLCFMDTLSKDVSLICKMQILGAEEESCTKQEFCVFKSKEVHEIWDIEDTIEWGLLEKHENGSLNFSIAISDGSFISEIEWDVNESYVPVMFNKEVFPSDFFRFYTEDKFCDVTLQASGKTFKVHKTVLCTMSPVFSAMFESGMKESVTHQVPIDDLDSDTVNQMLTFMYCGKIEKLDYEGVLKLFYAADKYQISLLKKTCRNFLQKNLCTENVVSVLSLANTHQDKELQDSAAYFIYRNDVFRSQKWKSLANDNPKLALEIFQDIYSKYF